MKILVTGTAGFIGFHVSRRLLAEGYEVVGLDNLNDYYSVQLKRDRLALLSKEPRFEFIGGDVADRALMENLFQTAGFERVAHLAAQAGVRYSLENPSAYVDSNLVGFGNILEGCRHSNVEHLVFASSSSVYGGNRKLPFSTSDTVDHPLSLYAATKRSNELMAHSYSHLFGLPTTGLRFFTVYGPWGRPDMAIYLFTEAILAGRPIRVFNHGRLSRDFTYIDDIVESVVRVIQKTPQSDPDWDPVNPEPASSSAPYRILNAGNHQPIQLMELIQVLEKCLDHKAILEMEEMQPGDVYDTCADTKDLRAYLGPANETSIREGLQAFVDWYRDYHDQTRSSSGVS